ncbi:imm11 family protein [Methylocystis bryophila]|uniref:imm11 family protein n=1 Tax=Methylocystis bryophila TaxID=655015 RepID=UPI003D817EB0
MEEVAPDGCDFRSCIVVTPSGDEGPKRWLCTVSRTALPHEKIHQTNVQLKKQATRILFQKSFSYLRANDTTVYYNNLINNIGCTVYIFRQIDQSLIFFCSLSSLTQVLCIGEYIIWAEIVILLDLTLRGGGDELLFERSQRSNLLSRAQANIELGLRQDRLYLNHGV